jgi:hypothetical protein
MLEEWLRFKCHKRFESRFKGEQKRWKTYKRKGIIKGNLNFRTNDDNYELLEVGEPNDHHCGTVVSSWLQTQRIRVRVPGATSCSE